jgi:lysyl-tRNA synthetase class 1
MSLAVPSEIDRVITDFDGRTDAFEAMDVYFAIEAAARGLGDLDEVARRGAFAEWAAFGFMPALGEASPWATHFAPMVTFGNEAGEHRYQPDLAQVDAEILSHWQSRAATVRHPVLAARYADLAWDLGAKVPGGGVHRDTAAAAADAYVATAAMSGREAMLAIKDAVRGLRLAMQVRDDTRIAAARTQLLALHAERVAAGDCQMEPFDVLTGERKAGLSEPDKARLVSDLEDLLARFADPTGTYFDPHVALDVAERLTRHYAKAKLKADTQRVHLAIAKAFEHFASLGSPMLASTLLQTSMDAYRAAGDRREAERIRRLMAEKVRESHAEMGQHSAEVTVTAEEQETFLRHVVADDPAATFMNLAVHLLLRRKSLDEQVAEQAKTSPLMAAISQSIISDDRVVATVGSVEDDPFGRVIRQACFMLEFSTPWLGWAVAKAVEVHGLTAVEFGIFINRAGLFGDGRLLAEGLEAWFAKDYVKAVHVLVPQVERGLRTLAGLKGQPTTKPSVKYGGAQMAVTMGDILYSPDYIAALGSVGPDLAVHFAALYADPRGKNVRNELAHGLMSAEDASEGLILWVVQSLLVLGAWAVSPLPGAAHDESASARTAP